VARITAVHERERAGGSAVTELERIRGFEATVEEREAELVVPFAYGVALSAPSLPDVYDLNVVRVERDAPVGELIAAADELQAPFHHRKIVVHDSALGARLAPGFAVAGWSSTLHVHMAQHGDPDRTDDTTRVAELSLSELATAHRTSTLRVEWGDEAIAERLLAAKRRRAKAVPTRHFGIREEGRVVAYCDLYETGGVAQIEDVNTLAEARGRGYGRALVARAAGEARSAGADLVFLDALRDDWPRELYSKLGFEVVGESYLFSLYPSPAASLNLRTPRLELRLPTDAEVLRLAHAIEEHGIHPREEMPFLVPWTDAIGTEAFVPNTLEHFRSQRARRRPEDWGLNFVAFLEGEPVGSQAMNAEGFPRERSVSTGSYLLRPFQGRGLGTEMRTAVLALAFDVLGAVRAKSGAMDGNEASARVSAKLGYEQVGWRERAPRGEPVRERTFELTRDAWRRQEHLPVQIDGPLDRVRAALGAG
jgi:RimJ/RimL family protein N-acetyltransferase/N-acetylglutamate synthase-like GNAT family acetyltransferase